MEPTSQRMLMATAGYQTTPPGQQVYTAGTYSWICPPGVTSISVVCIGAGGQGAYDTRSTKTDYGGGGGGGGELRYKNNISVTPGQSYQVDVPGVFSIPSGTNSNGAAGGSCSFNINTVVANGGLGGQRRTLGGAGGAGGSGGTGDGGGNGGAGGNGGSGSNASGGGAGGYSGNGGRGADWRTDNATAGSGGGASGGGSSTFNGYFPGSGGGGTGILGQGSSGAKVNLSSSTTGGNGGSGGGNGAGGSFSAGGSNGGGMGGTFSTGSAHAPAGGALRIIWPGDERQFPSTNTGDV